jgi:hypothetical protein
MTPFSPEAELKANSVSLAAGSSLVNSGTIKGMIHGHI